MLYAAALLAACCLSQSGPEPLRLSNVRQTFAGEFGPPRATSKYVPGDVLYVVFDVENLRRDARGKVQYAIGMDLLDAAGKSIFHAPLAGEEATLPLGGRKFPARVFMQLGSGLPQGKHALRVTVQDRATGAQTSSDQAFEVLPPRFAIVGVSASFDEEGQTPAPVNGFVGQSIWLRMQVVGFKRDAASNLPNIELKQTAIDPFGQLTLAEPAVYTAKDEPHEGQLGVPFHLALPLNRSGVFKVRLTATCKVSGQSHTLEVPVTVYPALK